MNNIKQIVSDCFNSDLGQQCETLFSTSDGKVVIRLEEAMAHADGKLDPDTKPLDDRRVKEWGRDEDGNPELMSIYNDSFIDSIIEDAHRWQLVTFPGATPASKIAHLKDEVKELFEVLKEEESLKPGDNRIKSIHHDIMSEYADCFLLLFGSAYKYGYTMSDIAQIIEAKMKINKARKWGKANDDGVVYHEKE